MSARTEPPPHYSFHYCAFREKSDPAASYRKDGAPREIRTPDLLVRSPIQGYTSDKAEPLSATKHLKTRARQWPVLPHSVAINSVR